MIPKKIEIMDTTLRDGEQMANVSYSASEKLNIAKILLHQTKVDRLELTSARVSEKEGDSIQHVIQNLGKTKKFEILGFVDNHKSIDWIRECGGQTLNLLTKGSLKHLTIQIKKTREEHLKDILSEIDYAQKFDFDVNVYLEDWSNGMLHSKEYVFFMIKNLAGKVKRIMLPDTLGVLNPSLTASLISETKNEFPDLFFDFHPHNDYGLATANCIAAVEAGADGLHLTVNGMGERAGNAPLEEVVTSIKDFFPDKYYTSIEEKTLYKASKTVEIYSTSRMSPNKAIVGSNVFTQTAGVHADGDKKGGLYENKLLPERFGREREYALGKLSGKANLEQNLKKMDIQLSESEKNKVLKKIIELSERKQTFTVEDLPYIIDDILDSKETEKVFSINSFIITTSFHHQPVATILIDFQGETIEQTASGDGGFDAFMNALRKISEKVDLKIPKLIDYQVNIPPGGKTDALVQTTIIWEYEGKEFKTKGVHSDQLTAAIEATEKVINKICG
ncbi:MAG TPA: 2-isopropylmalate synthase [Spirochaetia bacterium]|nr:MAG: 2-isopropylmalate synthase [Spirochaetes bacterium GWB1_36_13]HCL57055.1 2-isopropylmalate synthase [Spirochaetia bacterium]